MKSRQKNIPFRSYHRNQSQFTHCKKKLKTKILCWRTLFTFVVFLTIFSPTFWPAKRLKRNVSMLHTGKQKFMCRRVVLTQTTWKSLRRSWNYFVPELRKRSSCCINFRLSFRWSLRCMFLFSQKYARKVMINSPS